jgi:hypothetical protein
MCGFLRVPCWGRVARCRPEGPVNRSRIAQDRRSCSEEGSKYPRRERWPINDPRRFRVWAESSAQVAGCGGRPSWAAEEVGGEGAELGGRVGYGVKVQPRSQGGGASWRAGRRGGGELEAGSGGVWATELGGGVGEGAAELEGGSEGVGDRAGRPGRGRGRPSWGAGSGEGAAGSGEGRPEGPVNRSRIAQDRRSGSETGSTTTPGDIGAYKRS